MGIPKMRSLLVLIGSLSSSPVVTGSVSVTTDKGTLRGTSRSVNGVSVSSYLGVPFAQPPVNDLRFAAPQEESAWSGEWMPHSSGLFAVNPPIAVVVTWKQ